MLLLRSVDEPIECAALMKAVFCIPQRVQELEKENSLLKAEKEEMNQKILRQTSGGEFYPSPHLGL